MKHLARRVPRRLRHLLLAPSHEVRGWLAALSYRVLGPTTVTIRPGWTVRCHPRTATVFEETRTLPALIRELDRFIETCRPGMHVLDVGAHYGVFTLAALHYGGPTTRVVAVDPSPATMALLATNLDLNGVRDRVTLVPSALSANAGGIETLTTGATQHFQMVPTAPGRPDAQRVPATTVDQLAESHGAFTHIKIDVEGHELSVLQGGSTSIPASRPFLALELHNDILTTHGTSGAPILQTLADWGYTWVADDDEGRTVAGNDVLPLWVARMTCRPSRAPESI
jgi:FkbM family methyltransferase